MERYVDVEPGIRLWARESGNPAAEPLLLVMGANASGLTWPQSFVDALGERHRVIIYDHRDTGRSSWEFDTRPYPISRLAEDAVAVLDAFGIERAHVAGMSMGGILVQLLLLDHPDRLLSATLWSTVSLAAGTDETVLPGPDPSLLDLWQHLADPRDEAAEIEFRIGHWRALRGNGPFDAGEFGRLERRIIDHAGRHDNPAAHARASTDDLDRAADLHSIRTPTLVIDAPEDPINPPPHAAFIAAKIPGADLLAIPGLGHAIGEDVVPALTEAILRHTA
ncbi:alpha/beta fold hydrolase [Pseudonocardia spinosispora]|uniref:alpha/beta fold hydrolase n=1 Tax=Pseudonocardia spinosispora TaxID=103441 RepID=UPI0004268F76|nr:alpha/beta hydrolase [Pseudonocardia spinosispora]